MKNEDARLVNQFLAGDKGAFTTLVKKYQKSVHALAWRKVDDFHTAEELTQDTFLKAYQKLGTLKNPNQFAGWLYVIANRLCIAWHRKQKPPMESLETTHRMAVAGIQVYGVGDEGVYRLNNRDEWGKISSEVQDSVKTLVINNDRLYIVTEHRGMFYVSLEKK